jgi:hypothetical protein
VVHGTGDMLPEPLVDVVVVSRLQMVGRILHRLLEI